MQKIANLFQVLLVCICIAHALSGVAAGAAGASAALIIDCKAALTFATSGPQTVEILTSSVTNSGSNADGHTIAASFVSSEALVLLDEISMQVPVVCASSSMSAADLGHYQKRFPMIDHWVLESGGRVFSRGGRGAGGGRVMEENMDFFRYVGTCGRVHAHVCV